MVESDVVMAERVAQQRATLNLMMAAVLVIGEIVGLHDVENPWRLAAWLLMASLTAANLTPSGGWSGPMVTRIIITAAITAALISLGVQERRAAA